MNNKQLTYIVVGIGGAIVIGRGVYLIRKTRTEERAKRKHILNDMGLDVQAIHIATDVVNARIERGEINSYDDLRQAVLTEVAFQKIAIHEEQ